jgi:EAL domain-containing protein (putative c-di-GMP-specific phosphodiesterase class I)
VEDVRTIFAGSPIRLSQIVLEVTERQPLNDLTAAKRIIAALQGLGCKVAIDDVGSGHGGLSYLLKLGVDVIKIDKLFVDAIGTERYSTTIIESLIKLARSMRMDIVAEGVETFEQVTYLRDHGIRAAQGYVFSPPLPGSSFLKLRGALEPSRQQAAGDAQPPAARSA